MASEAVITFNEFAPAGAEEALKAVIVATAVEVRANAVFYAPVDEGRLINSLMWRTSWDRDAFGFPREGGFNEAGGSERATTPLSALRSSGAPEGVVGTAVEYGLYQEFGTRFMPAQPFLRPAADAVRGASAAAIAQRWGNAAMDREFKARKTTRRTTR